MHSVHWLDLLIWAAVISLAVMLLGVFFKFLKRFFKVWFVILLVLVALKLLSDAGWI